MKSPIKTVQPRPSPPSCHRISTHPCTAQVSPTHSCIPCIPLPTPARPWAPSVSTYVLRYRNGTMSMPTPLSSWTSLPNNAAQLSQSTLGLYLVFSQLPRASPQPYHCDHVFGGSLVSAFPYWTVLHHGRDYLVSWFHVFHSKPESQSISAANYTR